MNRLRMAASVALLVACAALPAARKAIRFTGTVESVDFKVSTVAIIRISLSM
ncbi:MAG: hypothetical protein JWN34_970 [Bryobacterales bacterium]|nr:hypothetical protein [Bryobacterales bacterium]